MLSSLIMSRHNLNLSRHSSIDVVCLMSRHGCLLLRQSFSQYDGFAVATDFFFIAIELCCLILMRLNFVSRQNISMLQHNLL